MGQFSQERDVEAGVKSQTHPVFYCRLDTCIIELVLPTICIYCGVHGCMRISDHRSCGVVVACWVLFWNYPCQGRIAEEKDGERAQLSSLPSRRIKLCRLSNNMAAYILVGVNIPAYFRFGNERPSSQPYPVIWAWTGSLFLANDGIFMLILCITITCPYIRTLFHAKDSFLYQQFGCFPIVHISKLKNHFYPGIH